MEKTLLIVESPAKAKTIGRYLGKSYKIAASVGHVRDLPSKTLGVNVKDQYKPQYVTMAGKEKVVRELKEAAKTVDRVLLATDPDREGEAIAFHLAHILKLDPQAPVRVTFNEITNKAVTAGVEMARPINLDLVDAQQSRRILDRLVGYELSPLLWKKIRKGLSAGRVQSVTTRLIVLREREIAAFVPEEYWVLTAHLDKMAKPHPFKARYHGQRIEQKVKKHVPASKEEADRILAAVKEAPFVVSSVKKRVAKRQPWAPYTTSTLQQDASRMLGFSSSRTMRIAQQLYEGVQLPGIGQTALITYIRTDSVRVSNDAIQEARTFIESTYGDAYLIAKPRMFKNKSQAQNAHEAIRPSHFELPPDAIEAKLTKEQARLYRLIWDRFMASQMAPAEFDRVDVDVDASGHVFRAKGERLRFAGFMALWKSQPASDDDQQLPELNDGETLTLQKLEPEQKFTQPPARYNEASLIKTMEDYGIGRPSTYAPTVKTIEDRGYVERLPGRTLKPTELGVLVTELLEENFETIVDPQFTAELEHRLDTVETGENDWVQIVDEFYKPLAEQIKEAESAIAKIEIPVIATGRKCPKCGEGDLVIKEGRYGQFIACSRYPECDHSEPIVEKAGMACPLCGSDVIIKTARKRRKKFYVCDRQGKDKDCPFISWDKPLTGEHCPTCGTYMVERRVGRNVLKKCGNKDCPTNARKKKAKEEEAVDENN